MNRNKQDDKEKMFWLGETSLEEERLLKSNAEDPYFETLRCNVPEKMDWNFEDFLQKVEKNKEQTNIIKADLHLKRFWWVAATLVTVLVMIGIGFLNKKSQNLIVFHKQAKIHEKTTLKDAVKSSDKIIASNNKNQQKTIIVFPKKTINSLSKRNRKINIHPAFSPVVTLPDSADSYQPQFVLINGKPVYNKEEAVKVTKQSLTLLVSNVDKGARHLAVIKELSIHF